MAVSMISNQAPAESNSAQSIAPVEYLGLDDIMDEVGLFMDVAMMDGTTDLPREEEVEPSITMLAELANAVPIPVTPSPSTVNLYSTTNPIAELEKSKLQAMAYHTAAAVASAAASSSSSASQKKPLIPKSSSSNSTKKKTVVKKKQTIKTVVPKPSPIKRSSSPSVVSDDGQPKEELSEERRNRNREHAKRSRQRKKSLTESLQKSVESLKKENDFLKQQIDTKFGKAARASVPSPSDEQVVSPAESFIRTLMNPESGNTTLSVSTVKYLKSLRDTVKVNMEAQQ